MPSSHLQKVTKQRRGDHLHTPVLLPLPRAPLRQSLPRLASLRTPDQQSPPGQPPPPCTWQVHRNPKATPVLPQPVFLLPATGWTSTLPRAASLALQLSNPKKASKAGTAGWGHEPGGLSAGNKSQGTPWFPGVSTAWPRALCAGSQPGGAPAAPPRLFTPVASWLSSYLLGEASPLPSLQLPSCPQLSSSLSLLSFPSER